MKLLTILILISCYSNLKQAHKMEEENILNISLPINKINIFIDRFEMEKAKRIIDDFEKRNQPINLNVLNEKGQGPIHYAAVLGQVDTLAFLLSHGADINLKNSEGETALHLTTSAGHSKASDFLIFSEANPDVKDNYGTNALVANIVTGDCSINIVSKLIGRMDPNEPIGLSGGNILHIVCDRANFECIEYLVGRVNINSVNIGLDTPLHLLIKSIKKDINDEELERVRKIIIRSEADIKRINKNNKTVQHIAIERRIEPLINLFHKMGLNRYEIEENAVNKLIELIRFYNKDIEISEGRIEVIQKALDSLFLKGEDFRTGNIEFLKVLAATFYCRWSKSEELAPSFGNQIAFIENLDENEEVDLTLIYDLVNNLNENDWDGDNSRNFETRKNSLFTKLKAINELRYLEDQSKNKRFKFKLKKVLSILPSIVEDTDMLKTILNLLFEKFVDCEVGVGACLDQILTIIGSMSQDDLVIKINQLLHNSRKDTLLEALTVHLNTVNYQNLADQQKVHLNLKVMKDFEYDFKITTDYDDPYNFPFNYDKEAIRSEFLKRYNLDLMNEILKSIREIQTVTPMYSYLQKLAYGRQLDLMDQEDPYKVECTPIFFTEDYSVNDDLIKGLLLYLGYLDVKIQ